MRQTTLWSLFLGTSLASISCSFDKIGDLGTDESADLGQAGGAGAAGMTDQGSGGCACRDEAETCDADGKCVLRCELDDSCDQDSGGTTDEPLVEAFGCPGEPVAADVLEAPWAESSLELSSDTALANQHLLIERSSAMSEAWNDSTRWERVLDALLRMPDPRPGTQRTLRFFPTSISDEEGATACDRLNYTDPVAVYDGSNFNAASILGLVAMLDPTGDNPLVPAVAGAIQGIVERRSASADIPDQLVLVLGSMPDQCIVDPSLEIVATLVRQARELEPPILTSVVAVGDGLDVDPIAEAGGTLPFRIGGSDDDLLLVRALSAGQTCHGFLPSLGPLDLSTPSVEGPFHRVEVYLTLEDGSVEAVPRLASASDCHESAQGGWYPIDAQDSGRIALCDCTLARASCGELYVLGSTVPAEGEAD